MNVDVGSLLRVFTVAVVPTLLDAVSLWMTALVLGYFGAVCMGPNPMRPWYFPALTIELSATEFSYMCRALGCTLLLSNV